MDHLLSIDQFDRKKIDTLFAHAEEMKRLVETKGGNGHLSHRVSANLFYEPSTRTSSSFAAAMHRLGGQVISINDVTYSSVSKGETLEDTIRTLEQYADVIILRHPEVGAAKRAAHVSGVPIINAGDGVGEHPTQALLDLFTILEEKGKIDGLIITLVGDLKNGRTVHSLVKLLRHYDVKLNFVAPESLAFPGTYTKDLSSKPQSFETLEPTLGDTDIFYVTRVQKERFDDIEEYEKVQGSYVINHETLAHMKPDARIMHPLPRVGEIAFEVDDDPRAAYFRQMRNGLYVRMAILDELLAPRG
jgi:aspartate carbamoyltransferase